MVQGKRIGGVETNVAVYIKHFEGEKRESLCQATKQRQRCDNVHIKETYSHFASVKEASGLLGGVPPLAFGEKFMFANMLHA